MMYDDMFTWRHLVSAAPESSAGSPSWPFPPHVADVSLPVLCAGPPGSFSFAHDASGAAGTAGTVTFKQAFTKET